MQYETNGQTRTAADNSGLSKVAVSFSADTFVVNQTFVIRLNICGENRHLSQAAKRCVKCIFNFSITIFLLALD